VQSIRKAVGTVKDMIAFFNASAKRNFIMKHFAGKQLQTFVKHNGMNDMIRFCNSVQSCVQL